MKTDNSQELICVGRDVLLSDGLTVDAIYVSPSGTLVIESGTHWTPELREQILLNLSSMTFDQLDAIAEDYYYTTKGQAYRIIDVMALFGYLSFSAGSTLSSGINHRLQSKGAKLVPTSAIVPSKRDHLIISYRLIGDQIQEV